jgi:hypothetical protein
MKKNNKISFMSYKQKQRQAKTNINNFINSIHDKDSYLKSDKISNKLQDKI